MPYIEKAQRKELDVGMDDRLRGATNPGELNYLITTLIVEYFHDNGGRYQQINDIVGALEGAKLEFYRRVVAPYEGKKAVENGEIY